MNATNAFVLCLFSVVLGALGAIQWNEEEAHRAAMQKARQPACIDWPHKLYARTK